MFDKTLPQNTTNTTKFIDDDRGYLRVSRVSQNLGKLRIYEKKSQLE